MHTITNSYSAQGITNIINVIVAPEKYNARLVDSNQLTETGLVVEKNGGLFCQMWRLTGGLVSTRGGVAHECNDLINMSPSLVNYDYYLQEVNKLVDPLKRIT